VVKHREFKTEVLNHRSEALAIHQKVRKLTCLRN